MRVFRFESSQFYHRYMQSVAATAPLTRADDPWNSFLVPGAGLCGEVRPGCAPRTPLDVSLLIAL